MEGVGARLGRSSSRYGTTTVFTGPVRKWKKKWIHVTPPLPTNANAAAAAAAANKHPSSVINGTNGNNMSHLLLYKWTPISKNSNGANGNQIADKDEAVAAEEPPRRRFKYMPIAVLEEQRKETEENTDNEAKPMEGDDPTSKNDEKPDINDLPMEGQATEENQKETARQDLNVSTFDLSLGFGEGEESERVNPGRG